jgi:hypothetical protein
MQHPMQDGHENDSGGCSNVEEKANQRMQMTPCSNSRKRQKFMYETDVSLLKLACTSQKSHSAFENSLRKNWNSK